MLNKVIRESLEKEYNSMKLKKNCKISENLRFHFMRNLDTLTFTFTERSHLFIKG